MQTRPNAVAVLFVSLAWMGVSDRAWAAPLSGAPRWNLTRGRGCTEGWDTRDRRPVRRPRVRCRDAAARPPSTARSTRIPGSSHAARKAPPPPAAPPSAPLPPPKPTPALTPDEPSTTRRPATGRNAHRRSAARGPILDASAIMALDEAACRDTLEQAGVRVTTVPHDEAPRVAQPVRLAGPVAGVTFAIPWSPDPARDHHTIWDCRLVVAVLPVARELRSRGIREVDYVSVLRRSHSGSRHEVALAIDIVAYRRHGDRFPVRTTYVKGAVQACRRGKMPRDVWGTVLCRAWREGQFHTILSPDHNRAHHDHLHLDLDEGRPSPTDPYVGLHGRSAGSLLPKRQRP